MTDNILVNKYNGDITLNNKQQEIVKRLYGGEIWKEVLKKNSMTDEKLKTLIGQPVEFNHNKFGIVVAILRGYGRDNIKVEFVNQFHVERRIYFGGDSRLFDRDQITDIEKTKMPEKQWEPRERKQRTRKPNRRTNFE